jgi:GntR family transcriptional regulator
MQVADALRRSIRDGEYTAGDKLPKIDDLAVQFGVARNTIQSALKVLTNDGLVTPRHGTGIFVRSSRPEPAPSSGSDGSRIDSVVEDLAEVREEVRALRQRMAQLESLVEERVSRDTSA